MPEWKMLLQQSILLLNFKTDLALLYIECNIITLKITKRNMHTSDLENFSHNQDLKSIYTCSIQKQPDYFSVWWNLYDQG